MASATSTDSLASSGVLASGEFAVTELEDSHPTRPYSSGRNNKLRMSLDKIHNAYQPLWKAQPLNDRIPRIDPFYLIKILNTLFQISYETISSSISSIYRSSCRKYVASENNFCGFTLRSSKETYEHSLPLLGSAALGSSRVCRFLLRHASPRCTGRRIHCFQKRLLHHPTMFS